MKFLTKIVILTALSMLFSGFVAAAHTANGTLTPEWSPASALTQYDVEICNEPGSDPLDEIRVIKNPAYSTFDCVDKSADGWITTKISPWFEGDVGGLTEMCWYFTLNSSNNIPAGSCDNFDFNATTPATESCNLPWKFETRDQATNLSGVWNAIFVSTGVDETDPVLTKMVTGPQNGTCPPAPNSSDVCWITDQTVIEVWVVDPGDATCDSQTGDVPPSGLAFCDVTVHIDGVLSPTDSFTAFDADDGTVDGEIHMNISWDEDSRHQLDVYCEDVAGNTVQDIETFRLDMTAPTTTKQFNGPQKSANGIDWIDGVTTVDLTAVDPDPSGFACNIGVDKTWYANTLAMDLGDTNEDSCWTPARNCGQYGLSNPYANQTTVDCINTQQDWCTMNWVAQNHSSWESCVESRVHDPQYCNVDSRWKLSDGSPISKDQESCHVLQYFSVDHLGNLEQEHVSCFFVDKTAPNVTKAMGQGPQYGTCPPAPGDINSTCYIDSTTEIDLWCNDLQPHPSGDEVISWRYRFTEDGVTWSSWNPNSSACSGTIVGDWCEEQTQHVTLSFPESSLHEMDWYCRDAVNKSSPVDTEFFRVDNDAPNITKTIVGPQLGQCPPAPNSNDTCYITNTTQIIVNVTDGTSVHASDHVMCDWRYHWNGSWTPWLGWFGEEGKIITLPEDSSHDLEIYCADAVGNSVSDIETFIVDLTPPSTTKTLGTPLVVDFFPKGCMSLAYLTADTNGLNGYSLCGVQPSEWITTDTEISLSATDAKSGVSKTWWRNLLVQNDSIGEQVCGHQAGVQQVILQDYCDPAFYSAHVDLNEPWTEYTGNFTKGEESCHIVEFYSEDNLGNVEQLNWNCLFVDVTEPLLNKTVGQPQYDNGSHLFVTQQTPITFSCADQDPHPVDHVMLHYRQRVANDCNDLGNANWSAWNWVQSSCNPYNSSCDPYLLEETIYFGEDSCHELEYYCEDGLGNSQIINSTQIDVVDSVAPTTTHNLLGPVYNNGSSDFIDTASSIELVAVDPAPHPSGVQATNYRVNLVADSQCADPASFCQPCVDVNGSCGNFSTYTGDFGIPQESCHLVEYYSVDNLGNTENLSHFCTFVDKQAPVTTKTLGTPFFTDGHADWINLATPVSLSAVDPQPHPSGWASTEYRFGVVPDIYCRNQTICQSAPSPNSSWTSAPNGQAVFNITEESCHVIEYFSVDNVNKTESLNRMCAYVDATGPLPNKTVGQPHGLWDGNGSFFDLTGRCNTGANDSVDCWTVTTLTPIDMACVDPQPHPVNHNNVCFKVIYDPTPTDDGDITPQYCQGVGNLTSDGYCCIQGEAHNFLLGEISEHNLSYYCEDALGNRGPLDWEMFKVNGDAFTIDLNKKWNLISVPFKLLDDNMEEVFKPVNNSVKSVWTYDAGTGMWSVFTPDGDPSNDNLNTMIPGWGYWVLSLADDQLSIAGNLFQAGPSTPVSRQIVGGAWNLIGYYGKHGIDTYTGPAGAGEEANCHLNSIAANIFTQDFTGLFGYWEPDNPNAFAAYGQFDYLDPGAGYWMFSPADGVYAPSTTCAGIGGIVPFLP